MTGTKLAPTVSPTSRRTSWNGISYRARWYRFSTTGRPSSMAISSTIQAAARIFPRSKSSSMRYDIGIEAREFLCVQGLMTISEDLSGRWSRYRSHHHRRRRPILEQDGERQTPSFALLKATTMSSSCDLALLCQPGCPRLRRKRPDPGLPRWSRWQTIPDHPSAIDQATAAAARVN